MGILECFVQRMGGSPLVWDDYDIMFFFHGYSLWFMSASLYWLTGILYQMGFAQLGAKPHNHWVSGLQPPVFEGKKNLDTYKRRGKCPENRASTFCGPLPMRGENK
jgi:hypothetical protein